MLPDGFHWRPFIDGPALYVADVVAAFITPVDAGYYRVSLASGRHVVTDNIARGMEGVERWALQWEARLRAHRAGGYSPEIRYAD